MYQLRLSLGFHKNWKHRKSTQQHSLLTQKYLSRFLLLLGSHMYPDWHWSHESPLVHCSQFLGQAVISHNKSYYILRYIRSQNRSALLRRRQFLLYLFTFSMFLNKTDSKPFKMSMQYFPQHIHYLMSHGIDELIYHLKMILLRVKTEEWKKWNDDDTYAGNLLNQDRNRHHTVCIAYRLGTHDSRLRRLKLK